jgi:hypothetical protein
MIVTDEPEVALIVAGVSVRTPVVIAAEVAVVTRAFVVIVYCAAPTDEVVVTEAAARPVDPTVPATSQS